MRIERVDLKAFGRFTNQSLDLARGMHQFHIIYGPNESGKSTTLRAITAWLFGMPTRSPDSYVHSYANMRVGGRLVSHDGHVLECVRRKGRAKTLLSPDEKTAIDEQQLSRLLAGLDEETFLRGFGLDRERLIAGGRGIIEGQGDLGEILFSAGVGVSRLSELKKQLDEEMRALYLPTGQRPQLNQTLDQWKWLRGNLKQAMLSTGEYTRRRQDLQTAEQQARDVKHQAMEAARLMDLYRRQSEAVPLVHQRCAALAQLQPLADVPRIDDQFVSRRRNAETDLRVARQSLDQLQQRQSRLQDEIQGLPDNQGLLRFATRVDALLRQTSVQQDAVLRLKELDKQAQDAETVIGDLLRRLGRERDTDISQLQVSDGLRDRIWELADSGVRLEQQVISETRRMDECRIDLAQAERALQTAAPPIDSSTLEALLRRMDNPDRLDKDMRQSDATLARLRASSRAALARLGGFSGDAEQALQLAIPSAASLERRAAAWTTSRGALEALDAELRAVVDAEADSMSQLEGLRRSGYVPCESELQQAREQRNQALAELIATDGRPASDDIHRLRELVAEADGIVDALRTDAALVAKRSQIECSVAALQHKRSHLEQSRSQLAQSHAAAVQEWESMWRALGVEASSPGEMQHWLERHQALCEAAHAEADAERERQALQQQCDEMTRRLLDALRPLVAGDKLEPMGFIDLYDLAVGQQEQLQTRRQTYEASRIELDRLRRETGKLTSSVERGTRDLERWKSDWTDAISQLTSAGDEAPEEVRRLLEVSDSIAARHRELETVRAAISRIHDDRGAFERSVRELVKQVRGAVEKLQWADADSFAAVEQLADHLRRAQNDDQQRRSLKKQCSETDLQRREHQQTIVRCESELQTLCREVRCDDPENLPEIERRAVERDRVETELRQIEHQLRRLAGHQSIDDFIASIDLDGALDLDDEVARLEEAIQVLDAQQIELNRNVGALRQQCESMDGRGLAADINQQIQTTMARAARQSRQFAVLAVQSAALGEAIEHYRQRNQGPILSRAEGIFTQMTCGDYTALRPHYDEKGNPILVGLRGASETMVPANCFSEGTADALFLSLRLASLLTHIEHRGPMPLIIDDVLVQFDDDRSAAALRVLCEIASQTQVIFFTHHRHLLDLADSHLQPDHYHTHTL